MHTLVQHGAAEDEMRALHSYEELMLEWMGNFVSRVLFTTGSGGGLGKWRGMLDFGHLDQLPHSEYDLLDLNNYTCKRIDTQRIIEFPCTGYNELINSCHAVFLVPKDFTTTRLCHSNCL